MTEMYETKADLKQPFMKDNFMERIISYNLNGNDAQLPKVWTTSSSFGIETLAYLGNKLWLLIIKGNVSM